MRDVLGRRTRHLVPVLDRLYDPNNVAACLRTADALGLQDVHVVAAPRVSARGLREDARAVALDAGRWVTRVRHADPAVALARLEAEGYRVVVAGFAADARAPEELPLDRPLAVVFGAERDGVTGPLAERAALRVTLPMRGFVQSLNVAAALAVIMSRLRDRLDAELAPAVWQLDSARAAALLDAWLVADVAHAERILAELERRDGPA